MKKLISLVTITVLVVGVTFAQGIQDERNQTNDTPRAERQRNPQQKRVPQQQIQREPRKVETVTISGTLKLEKGIVAVQSGEKTHLVPMLNRYIGFINGLQEGKTVSVEGIAGRNMLHPQKLTIDGKEYEFGRRMLAQGSAPRQIAPRQHIAPRHAPNHRYAPHQRYRAPQRGGRNREDRPNREERTRRNAPSGTSSLQTDAV